MNKAWPTVKLGEVLWLDLDRVPVDASVSYPMVGVLSFGRGLFEREPIENGKTSYRVFYRLKAEHIVMSQLFGWEGALALSEKKFAGKFLSPQFPTFLCDTSKLDRAFLGWLMRRPTFWEDLGSRASGMGDRRRTLNPEALFKCEIPLPPLAEQQRVVARIEELAAQIHEACTLRHQATEEAESLMASRLMYLFDEAAETNKNQARLGDVCTFQGGSQPAKLQFAYEPRESYVRLIQIRDYKSDDYLTFVPKDSVRKFCTADDVMIGRYGPPIFQILRGIEGAYNVALMKATPDDNCLFKDFLFRLLQEPRLFQKVEEDSQRTSGQTGIRRELLEDHITFVPPLPEQRRIVAELDALQAEADALKRLQAETGTELDALLPSILDKAFKGEL